jgi:outer membrane protein assembly factor BamA
MLDLNIRPLYEQAGRLGMTYSKVTVEPADRGVVVTTALSEGPVYVLKNALVTVDGAAPDAVLRVAQLPIGKIANWRAVQDGLEAATDTLKSEGYLEARYEVERTLDDQAGTAVAKVAFQRGPQFTFGALQIEGVPADLELRVRELWRLPAGAPANETYVNQFLRTAFQVLGRDYRSVSKEIEVRPGTRVVDVTARFAR